MKTAVEWLQEEFNKWAEGKVFIPQDLLEEAKRLENNQLKEMYLKGIENYDPTFKRKSQWTEVDNMTKRLI